MRRPVPTNTPRGSLLALPVQFPSGLQALLYRARTTWDLCERQTTEEGGGKEDKGSGPPESCPAQHCGQAAFLALHCLEYSGLLRANRAAASNKLVPEIGQRRASHPFTNP